MTDIDWNKTEALLCLLPRNAVHKLIKLARRELWERHEERVRERERFAAAMNGMANVMAGVTWALACRQSLRRSKGHVPDTGVRPQSGEMWLPRELLYAVRHEVKERHWSPLSSENWDNCRGHLSAEATRRAPADESDVVSFETAMLENAGKMDVAKFVVRRSKGEARVLLDVTDGVPQ